MKANDTADISPILDRMRTFEALRKLDPVDAMEIFGGFARTFESPEAIEAKDTTQLMEEFKNFVTPKLRLEVSPNLVILILLGTEPARITTASPDS